MGESCEALDRATVMCDKEVTIGDRAWARVKWGRVSGTVTAIEEREIREGESRIFLVLDRVQMVQAANAYKED